MRRLHTPNTRHKSIVSWPGVEPSIMYAVYYQVKPRCNLFMVLYLCPMSKFGLHAVLWSHIGIPKLLLPAEPRSSAEPLLPSKCPCGRILLTLHSMVWDWRISRAVPMLIYWPKRLYPFLSFTIFPFLFLLSNGWYFEAGVFGLAGCRSLSPSLSLPTSFNNDDNNNNDNNPHHSRWQADCICAIQDINNKNIKTRIIK